MKVEREKLELGTWAYDDDDVATVNNSLARWLCL